jgi:hypothetical protein
MNQNRPFRPPGRSVGRGVSAQGKTRRSLVLRLVLSYSRKGYSEAVIRQEHRDVPALFGKRAAYFWRLSAASQLGQYEVGGTPG